MSRLVTSQSVFCVIKKKILHIFRIENNSFQCSCLIHLLC
uniref:Uncharacterized protein n=1 Tax=Rhizophora mucronata TaxID=61149 RepID=A0A2P2P5H2_RHIMU